MKNGCYAFWSSTSYLWFFFSFYALPFSFSFAFLFALYFLFSAIPFFFPFTFLFALLVFRFNFLFTCLSALYFSFSALFFSFSSLPWFLRFACFLSLFSSLFLKDTISGRNYLTNSLMEVPIGPLVRENFEEPIIWTLLT